MSGRLLRFPTFPSMPEKVPEGKHGAWSVEHFTVSARDAEKTRMHAVVGNNINEIVSPGRYARLMHGKAVVMSDTDMERRSNTGVIHKANGHVLIGGLGLGMIVWPLLEKPGVEKVVVIEQSADVIALIKPTFDRAPNREILQIIEGDVYEWKPVPTAWRFDTVYFDIWTEVSTDNLAEMGKLHRRYARWMNRENPKRWLGSWQREWLLYRRGQERRMGW